jgi:rRNA-processing protein EBP2
VRLLSLIIHHYSLFSNFLVIVKKKEHKGALHNAQADGDEAFDVAVEDAIADRRPAKRARGGKVGSSLPRHARDKKFGFGGHGKRDKQNTRSSTDDFEGSARRGSSGGLRGRGRGRGHSRLGKSRRVAARSRS